MPELNDRPFGWDDEVTVSTTGDFTLLPEGDYDFTVTNFERSSTQGSAKMSSSLMAVLTLACTGPHGSGNVRANLILNDKTSWKIYEFFKSCGLIPQTTDTTDTIRFPWSRVPGAHGRCHLGVRSFIGNDGQKRESNDVTRFLAPAAGAPMTLPASF